MEKVRTLKQFGIEVPEAEYAPPGHTACAGCAGAAMLRQMLKFLGPKVIMTNPASCSGYFGRALEVPLCRCLFEAAAASGTGIRAALDVMGDKETHVLALPATGVLMILEFKPCQQRRKETRISFMPAMIMKDT